MILHNRNTTYLTIRSRARDIYVVVVADEGKAPNQLSSHRNLELIVLVESEIKHKIFNNKKLILCNFFEKKTLGRSLFRYSLYIKE